MSEPTRLPHQVSGDLIELHCVCHAFYGGATDNISPNTLRLGTERNASTVRWDENCFAQGSGTKALERRRLDPSCRKQHSH